MSGNSWASALQTAPIVSDLLALAEPRRARASTSASSASILLGASCRLGGHQRAWKVSLYLPICTSSPSSRRWDSIRERLT